MDRGETAEPRRLLHRRAELARRHERTQERVALFPNPVNTRQLEELAAELSDVEARLRDAESAA